MAELPLREPDDDLLPLLRKCTNKDLAPLVSYITKKGGISSELQRTKAYKKYYPNHKKYADEIAAEVQKFGGNTIVNLIRGGKGVPYREIVCDVAKKLKVNFNKKRETEFIEQQIVLSVLEKAWDKMSEKEKKAFIDGLGIDSSFKSIPKSFPIMLLQSAVKIAGFAPYKYSVIVANALSKLILKRGLSFAATYNIPRSISIFAGPIGWVISGIWTAFDLAAPAYRVILPCVFHIAMLRQKYALLDKGIDLNGGVKTINLRRSKVYRRRQNKNALLPAAA